MTQPSTFYTSQKTFKKLHSHNNYRSKVRETARKFDSLGKSNDLPPSPEPSHHSTIAIQVNNNNNHINGTFTSSISSSSESIASEYAVNPSPIEHKRSLSVDQSTLNSKHISTATIEIRPLAQPKLTLHRKRSSPPASQSLRAESKSKQNDDLVYVNSDHEIGKQHNNFHEADDENEIEETESLPSYAKPIRNHREIQLPSSIQTTRSKLRRNSDHGNDEKSSRIQNRSKHSDVDSIGLEITEPVIRKISIENGHLNDQRILSLSANYETPGTPRSSRRLPPPPPLPPQPAFAKSFLQKPELQDEPQSYEPRRSFPLSNFMMELGALLVVFILCMVLVLAIKEDETQLRTTSQLVYTYIYVVSIIWMIWCTFDIVKFRRQWMELTAGARDHEEYMGITQRHPDIMFYFPDIHNTGGLFMRIGAGLLCMGGLILTVIELGKTVVRIGSDEPTRAVMASTYSLSVIITRIISYIFRFIFHCVQFTFLFRYGNLVINRYHFVAKIGLIHLMIANFCTWFEAIVYETLEQMHRHPDTQLPTTDPINVTYSTTPATSINDTDGTSSAFELIKGVAAATTTSVSGTTTDKTIQAILQEIELSMGPYLYPCLIEYSLISLTVFFIMWRNVGKIEKRSYLRFADRHVFTINCARASRGLLIGGIIFLLTILALIPTYLLDADAISVTHLTELVLLIVSLFTVCLSYFYTTKLYYDQHAHVDVFDQVLILITTVGEFAYSIFGLFASIFVDETKTKLPFGVEISIRVLAIFQTFVQSSFIMDTLKRRTTTKQENRNKPGRETITALLLMNLAIWLHDSLSANKVILNPSQVAYYDVSTWAIIQAFTSPLSIFYRFHSSVCLADIWQEVYNGNNDGTRLGENYKMNRLMNVNNAHENQH